MWGPCLVSLCSASLTGWCLSVVLVFSVDCVLKIAVGSDFMLWLLCCWECMHTVGSYWREKREMDCCHSHKCHSPLRVTLGSQRLYYMVSLGVLAVHVLWALNGQMVRVQLARTRAACFVHIPTWCSLASVLCLSHLASIASLSSYFFFLLFSLCHPVEPSVSSHVPVFEESLSPILSHG